MDMIDLGYLGLAIFSVTAGIVLVTLRREYRAPSRRRDRYHRELKQRLARERWCIANPGRSSAA